MTLSLSLTTFFSTKLPFHILDSILVSVTCISITGGVMMNRR